MGGKWVRNTRGDLSVCLDWLPRSEGFGMGGQKSAEGIVAAAHGGEGPNMEDRKGTQYLDG